MDHAPFSERTEPSIERTEPSIELTVPSTERARPVYSVEAGRSDDSPVSSSSKPPPPPLPPRKKPLPALPTHSIGQSSYEEHDSKNSSNGVRRPSSTPYKGNDAKYSAHGVVRKSSIPGDEKTAYNIGPPNYEEHERISFSDGVRRTSSGSSESVRRTSKRGVRVDSGSNYGPFPAEVGPSRNKPVVIPLPHNPHPPNYEEHSSRRSSGDGVHRTSSGANGAGSDAEPPREKEVMKPEIRRLRWAMFVVGNLLSAAIVIFEISKLSICFDGYVDDDDWRDESDIKEAIDSNATFTYVLTMFTLVFGFWVELLSTFALSIIYHSPLDIKSVHKVPPDDLRHCGASIIVNFLAPFSWAVIYIFGGLASVNHATNTSCGGQKGSGLELYLLVSGSFMLFGGLGMLAVSAVILVCSCGSPTRRTDRCCAVARQKIHSSILTKGPYLHVFWIVQGAVWSFRAGGFGLASLIFLGMGGIFAEVLSACGSIAPEIVVQTLVGGVV